MRQTFLPIVGLGLVTLRWLMTRGGGPKQNRGRFEYKLRPGMRLASYGFILLGFYLCYFICSEIVTQSRTEAFWVAVLFAPICIVGGFYILSCYFVIDDEGLHEYSWFGKHADILWANLDHYEEMRKRNRTGGGYVYFFRPLKGKSLSVDDSGYDAQDMIERIQERHKLILKPYKRQKWYGG